MSKMMRLVRFPSSSVFQSPRGPCSVLDSFFEDPFDSAFDSTFFVPRTSSMAVSPLRITPTSLEKPMKMNLDVSETDAGVSIVADLPGVPKEDISISLDGKTLTLKAERRSELADGDPLEEGPNQGTDEPSAAQEQEKFGQTRSQPVEGEDGRKRKSQWKRIERTFGSVTRVIRLPNNVNEDQIEANCKDGILRINIPKMPKPEAKIIPIQ